MLYQLGGHHFTSNLDILFLFSLIKQAPVRHTQSDTLKLLNWQLSTALGLYEAEQYGEEQEILQRTRSTA